MLMLPYMRKAKGGELHKLKGTGDTLAPLKNGASSGSK